MNEELTLASFMGREGEGNLPNPSPANKKNLTLKGELIEMNLADYINFNLVMNLLSLTLNNLTRKKVFKNGLNFSALLAGSLYYFSGRERNAENVERMRRLVLLAKEELEKDYLQYWKCLNDKLIAYI